MIDEFNSMKFNESRFSLLHLNARNLNKNIDQLALFINSQITHFILLLLTKLWKIKIFQVSLNLPGYNCMSVPWSVRGGGVALFIKDTTTFKCRHDLSNIYDNSFESVFIENLKY